MGVINTFQAKKVAVQFLFLAVDFVGAGDQVGQKKGKNVWNWYY